MADWTTPANGNWADAARWTGGVPNAAGATANFIVPNPGNATVLINFSQNASFTVGTLNLTTDSDQAWTFQGDAGVTSATLRFQGAGGGPAFLNADTNNSSRVSSISDFNGMKVTLASDLIVTTADSATAFEIRAPITGAFDVYKFGGGTLRVSGGNSAMTGDYFLNGGRTELTSANAVGGGSIIKLNNGATLAGVNTFTLANKFETGAGNATGVIVAKTGTTLTLAGQLELRSFSSSAVTFGSATDTGTITLSGTSLINGAGGFFIGGGTLRFGNAGVAANYFSALSTTSGIVALQPGAVLDTGGFAARIDNLGLDGVLQSTGGALDLTSDQSFSSATFSGTIVGTAQADRLVFNVDGGIGLGSVSFNSWTDGTDTITINGSDNPNFLSGSTRNDTINGGGGNDHLIGGDGNDTLNGGDGDDVLDSGVGVEVLDGGDGDDGFFFGAAFTAADRVDGGAGVNDQIGLQGNYAGASALVLGTNTIANIEAIVVLPGFSYNITIVDANVAAGAVLKVQATQLAAGQSLTFNGSAESNGSFMVFGGQGNDSMTGGSGNDGFYFGPGGFSGADAIDGGGGTNDQLALDGDYGGVGAPFLLGGNIANVEVLALLHGPTGTPNHFNLATLDTFVAAGQTMTIFGLQVTTDIRFDGANEHDGAFKIYGGSGNDVFTGGTGNDWIFGGGGSDAMTGGAGSDTFFYDDVSQSTSLDFDRIFGFDDSIDKIDLPFAVTGFAGPASGNLSTGSFNSDLSAAFAGLTSHQAGMFTATGGNMAGRTFLVVDADGNAGYQAGSDYVMEIVSPATPVDNPAIFI